MKNVFKLFPFLFLLIAMACGSDEETPKYELTNEDIAIPLADANIYFQDRSSDSDERISRSYVITDGTYDGGYIWDLYDYRNATYIIHVQLSVPGGDSYKPGKYPTRYYWDEDAPELVSYIIGKKDGYEFETSTNSKYQSDVVVKGGLEDGEIITISFKGTLDIDYYDNTLGEWFSKRSETSFLAKGTLTKIDYRD
jgi:hypothetical protein